MTITFTRRGAGAPLALLVALAIGLAMLVAPAGSQAAERVLPAAQAQTPTLTDTVGQPQRAG